MRKFAVAVLTLCLSLSLAFAAGGDPEKKAGKDKDKKDKSLTAWVADSHCAAKHAKPGGEKCVAKCIEGGAKVVLATPDGESVLTVTNPEKLAGHEGKLVKVEGKIDREANTIEVASVESAPAPAGQHAH